jgi:hypothetical protein
LLCCGSVGALLIAGRRQRGNGGEHEWGRAGGLRCTFKSREPRAPQSAVGVECQGAAKQPEAAVPLAPFSVASLALAEQSVPRPNAAVEALKRLQSPTRATTPQAPGNGLLDGRAPGGWRGHRGGGLVCLTVATENAL